MMIETLITALLVTIAAAYWYARVFPAHWHKLKSTLGFSVPAPAVQQSKGCAGCKACSGKSGGCH